MNKYLGFTLVELLMFIVILSILASTILLSTSTALLKSPRQLYTDIAAQLASQCMEGFIGQRRLGGYTGIFSAACPNTPATIPALCSSPPAGYAITTPITCGPTLNGDSTYNTLTVNVTGKGSASRTILIASY